MKKRIITLYYHVTCAILRIPFMRNLSYHWTMRKAFGDFCYLAAETSVLGKLYRALA